MAENLNEDRAYALAALAAGVEFMWNEERSKWGAAPNEGPTVWLDNFSDYHMVEDYAAAGRALDLHAEAKAILEEMAGPVPVVDIHGRVLAAEGYVLVPRDVAEKAVLYQLALHSWMDEGSEGMAVSPSEVLANYVALADALKKEG